MDRRFFPIMLALATLCLASCGGGGEHVVWDFRKGNTPAAVGWKPSGRFDVADNQTGDIDFTFINERGRVFHQRCFSIGCMRNTKTNRIDGVYAHFCNGITVDKAVPLAKEILTTWAGGIEDDPNQMPPNVENWLSAMRSGHNPEPMPWYTVVGANDTGFVRITIMGPLKGGQTECSLMFSPQRQPPPFSAHNLARPARIRCTKFPPQPLPPQPLTPIPPTLLCAQTGRDIPL